MDEFVQALCKLPHFGDYKGLDLLTLSEHCAVLEEQLYVLAKSLPPKSRHLIEAYISSRNDLEVETVKTALRWGKQYYK